MKCESLNRMEVSGPVQARNGIAVPLPLPLPYSKQSRFSLESIVTCNFFFLRRVHTNFRAYQHAIQGVKGAISTGVKLPENKDNYFHLVLSIKIFGAISPFPYSSPQYCV